MLIEFLQIIRVVMLLSLKKCLELSNTIFVVNVYVYQCMLWVLFLLNHPYYYARIIGLRFALPLPPYRTAHRVGSVGYSN